MRGGLLESSLTQLLRCRPRNPTPASPPQRPAHGPLHRLPVSEFVEVFLLSSLHFFEMCDVISNAYSPQSRTGIQLATKRKKTRVLQVWGEGSLEQRSGGRKHVHIHKGPLDVHLTDKLGLEKPGRWSLFDSETGKAPRILKTETG